MAETNYNPIDRNFFRGAGIGMTAGLTIGGIVAAATIPLREEVAAACGVEASLCLGHKDECLWGDEYDNPLCEDMAAICAETRKECLSVMPDFPEWEEDGLKQKLDKALLDYLEEEKNKGSY